MKSKNTPHPKTDHLDELQARLGIKLRRTDAFDFCYWHFYELMEFTLLFDPEIARADSTGKLAPINYKDKRNLVKLLREYDLMTETISMQKSAKTWTPRVPLRHCFKSLERAFDKHFDDLLFITHEEEKINNQKTKD